MFLVFLVLLVTRCEPCPFGSFLKNDFKVVKMFRKPDYFIKSCQCAPLSRLCVGLEKIFYIALHGLAWP